MASIVVKFHKLSVLKISQHLPGWFEVQEIQEVAQPTVWIFWGLKVIYISAWDIIQNIQQTCIDMLWLHIKCFDKISFSFWTQLLLRIVCNATGIPSNILNPRKELFKHLAQLLKDNWRFGTIGIVHSRILWWHCISPEFTVLI